MSSTTVYISGPNNEMIEAAPRDATIRFPVIASTAESSSYSVTASYAVNAGNETSSYALSALTASYSIVITNYVTASVVSSSWASSSYSSSYALSASFAANFVSGTSGTSGTNGSSGTSGTNGSSGTSGTNGTSGTRGTSGTNGTSGTSGTNGSSGTSGTTPVDYVVTASGALTNATASYALETPMSFGVIGNLTNNAYWGNTEPGTASINLTFGNICYYHSSSKWDAASASTGSNSGSANKKLSVCVQTATALSQSVFLLYGKVRADTPFPTFGIGSPVYLSETSGSLSVAAPTNSKSTVRIVGYGNTADELYFTPSNEGTVLA
jgi:hypothetical protein